MPPAATAVTLHRKSSNTTNHNTFPLHLSPLVSQQTSLLMPALDKQLLSRHLSALRTPALSRLTNVTSQLCHCLQRCCVGAEAGGQSWHCCLNNCVLNHNPRSGLLHSEPRLTQGKCTALSVLLYQHTAPGATLQPAELA